MITQKDCIRCAYLCTQKDETKSFSDRVPKDFVDVLSNAQNDLRPSTITWDTEKDFLEKYRVLMKKAKSGDSVAYYQVKELRTKEFRNTVEIVDQGHY